MLYCAKCRGVCPDATSKCPNCKSSKLRPVAEEDLVLLHRADQYTAGLLEKRFQEQGLSYRMEPFQGERISYLYEGDVMPTDKTVLVAWKDYSAAKELSAQVSRQVEEERAQAGGEGETFQDMPRKKRILVQTVSVLAFLLVVMLVVFGADAAANWLKNLF